MKVTVLTADERIVSLDVEPDELVENLKAILEVETQVPLAQQQLLFNGREIPNSSRLNAAGVGDNDLLMLVSARAASSLIENSRKLYRMTTWICYKTFCGSSTNKSC